MHSNAQAKCYEKVVRNRTYSRGLGFVTDPQLLCFDEVSVFSSVPRVMCGITLQKYLMTSCFRITSIPNSCFSTLCDYAVEKTSLNNPESNLKKLNIESDTGLY